MYTSRLVLCVSLIVCTLSFGADAEVNPVRKHPQAIVQTDTYRVIVKFRAGSAVVAGNQKGNVQSQSTENRAVALARRASLKYKESHEIVAGIHALQVQPAGSGESLETALARLRADPAVEYAELDQRRYIHAIPNDSLFISGQWHLKNDSTAPGAIDASSAWDTTTGDNGIVIAEIDTGVRFDHPDLERVEAAGRLLAGYDFITDSAIANDGDGRDADASDSGDWVSQADKQNPKFQDCDVEDSSWHGTRVAGILGALSNNVTGVAGITWSGRILPVRGLGKCGGFDSDIIPAMLWAAGIDVTGAPHNSNPAKIVNMSLGSTGSCSQSYRDAISQITARGVLIVVSAGNEGGPVDTPANCPGVAGIAGLRHIGTKVGFSSLGTEIALSAPGGNCVNTSGPCLYSLDTTSNNGATTPGSSIYTDQFNFNLGTSFSAPIVAGIAALMASVNSNLNSAQLIARLQSGASKPFPKSSDNTIPDCHVPANANDLQDSECNCTTSVCGAGMANASRSVAEALRPFAIATANPTSAAYAQTVSLDGSASFASNGRAIVTYAWTVVSSSGGMPTIGNSDSQNASFTAGGNALVTLRLTVTDDRNAQDSTDIQVATPTVALTVTPATANVQAGSGTQAFSATVTNASNTAVTWQVNGVTGGNSTVGTISGSGLYTAPPAVPSPATVTIAAISVVDTSRSGSAQVTVTQSASVQSASHKGGGGAIDGLMLLAALLVWMARSRLRWPVPGNSMLHAANVPCNIEMRTILGWGMASIASAVAWWLGAYINLGAAVILSAIAGGFGLYWGYRWFDENLG